MATHSTAKCFHQVIPWDRCCWNVDVSSVIPAGEPGISGRFARLRYI